MQNQKIIFISHSSADKDVADALVDMLCSALNLRVSDFLCTSVDGAKLRGGDETNVVLRRSIREVPAFLSILTPKAVVSTYVLFELGARWGTEKSHIPLLAKGAGDEFLKEPLKSTNALRLTREEEVLQLVDDVGQVLNRKPEPLQSYLQKVRKVVEVSKARETPKEQMEKLFEDVYSIKAIPAPTPRLANGINLSDAAKRLLKEASNSGDGNVSKLKSASYGWVVSIHTQNQNFLGDISDNRNRALWVHAFDELVRAGHFESISDNGIYRITHTGYQLADILKKQESK